MGISVAISADARFLAVGANQGNSTRQGYVQVFSVDDGGRTQLGTNILGENDGDLFGDSLDISDDGTILAVGATGFKGSDGVSRGTCTRCVPRKLGNFFPRSLPHKTCVGPPSQAKSGFFSAMQIITGYLSVSQSKATCLFALASASSFRKTAEPWS
jgi:hypothetical protein